MEATVNIIDYDKIYSSNNYGDFIFLEELSPHIYNSPHGRLQERTALIKFIQTGTVKQVLVRDAIKGAVKDQYYPKIYGVGCVGNTYTNEDHRYFYNKWKAMLSRCYNKKDPKYKFYKKCSVSKEWLCFENFVREAPILPGFVEMMLNQDKQITYTLDKDILQQGKDNKIYSKETCMWVPFSENRRQEAIDYRLNKDASSKYYGVVLDQGKYKVQSSVRTQYGNPVGMYTDEIAAVNMREYFRRLNYPEVIPNEEYPYMPLNEALKYKCVKKKRIPLFKTEDNSTEYIGVEPFRYAANRWVITDVFYNGQDLGAFVNLDAALSVREYYRAIYYPYLPKNYNYNHMPIYEAMRFKFHKENPKLLFRVENKDNK